MNKILKKQLSQRLFQKIRSGEMLTQGELASNLGIARITAHYYEKGKRTPSDKVMEKIQKLYPQYLDTAESKEEEHIMDDRIVSTLLDANETLKSEIQELKQSKKANEFQQLANESIGSHVWVYQAQIRRNGLRFERKLTDIGNGKDIFMQVLGYNEDEADMYLTDEWLPAMPSKQEQVQVYSVVTVDTFKHLYKIFLKLPMIIKHISDGIYKIDLPFSYRHKEGHTISSVASMDIDIKTLTVTTTNYFFDESGNIV